MESMISTTDKTILTTLISMYEQEERIYQEIKDLSIEQGEILKSGGALSSIQSILLKKRSLLDEIARLEIANSTERLIWEKECRNSTDDYSTKVRRSLKRVSMILEDIINCEAENDQLLLENSVERAI